MSMGFESEVSWNSGILPCHAQEKAPLKEPEKQCAPWAEKRPGAGRTCAQILTLLFISCITLGKLQDPLILIYAVAVHSIN